MEREKGLVNWRNYHDNCCNWSIIVLLLSGGNAIVGTWVDNTNEATFNKDGTVSMGGIESVISSTWEIQGDKLMQTTITNVNGSEILTYKPQNLN